MEGNCSMVAMLTQTYSALSVLGFGPCLGCLEVLLTGPLFMMTKHIGALSMDAAKASGSLIST